MLKKSTFLIPQFNKNVVLTDSNGGAVPYKTVFKAFYF